MPKDSPVFGKDWYSTDLFTEWGLKFIDEARAEKKPFFLYIAQGAVHFPLRAPAEMIAKYRGKYMAGWDKLREERHAKQIELGLVDAEVAAGAAPAGVAGVGVAPADRQERFDEMMAVYAAMIDRIDLAMGTLVDGLKQRGVLDNTLILFLSDNGGNAEGGPPGVTRRRRADRRPAIVRAARHELGDAGEHAVPPLQAFHPRRRHQHAAHRPLAGGHSGGTRSGSSGDSSRGISSTSWRPPSIWPARSTRASSTATPSSRCRASASRPAFEGKPLAPDASRSSGSTRATRRCATANGSWSCATDSPGSSTTWRPTAPSSTT